jgi:uncharacterized membrane protein/predicted DsbA family dithiol-disulfide isomerase
VAIGKRNEDTRAGLAKGRGTYNSSVSAVVLNRILGVLAWAGVMVAGLLTLSHATGSPLICGEHGGCEAVAAHPSSYWLGIPVAVYGLVSYLVLAALALIRAHVPGRPAEQATKAGFLLSGMGTLASAYLMMVMVTQIRATCPWCIVSAVIMLLSLVFHAALASATAAPSGPALPDRLIAGIGAVVAIGAVGTQFAAMPAPAIVRGVTPELLAPKEAYWKGDPDARVHVVEYADVFCVACRVAYPALKEIFMGGQGRIRWAFRGYPLRHLPGHEMSLPVTVASEIAAEGGRFWAFLDAAFTEDVENMRTLEDIAVLLERVGGDGEDFLRRVRVPDPALVTIVHEDRQRADRLGVRGTPMFIVFAEGQEPMIAPGVEALRRLLNRPEYARLWRPDGG